MSAGAALGGHVAARLDLAKVDTPAYVTDLGALEDNLKLLASVMERAGVTIILALKGFAQWSTFPLVKRYLKGTTASSIAEARLGREEFGGEVHAYAPAWSDEDLREVVTLAKLDLTEPRVALATLRAQFAARGIELWAISAATGEGVAELMDEVYRRTSALPVQSSTAA